MSELVDIVDSLENKISKLLHKLELLHHTNIKLEEELVAVKNDHEATKVSVNEWQEKYNSLKLASSMLGSDTNKTEAKLKIKLSIADRVYPLTIDPLQEEGLRKAAKNIEQLAKKFEQNYAVRDKQDVLAMCALQFASKIEQKGIDHSEGVKEAAERLKALNMLVSSKLGMK